MSTIDDQHRDGNTVDLRYDFTPSWLATLLLWPAGMVGVLTWMLTTTSLVAKLIGIVAIAAIAFQGSAYARRLCRVVEILPTGLKCSLLTKSVDLPFGAIHLVASNVFGRLAISSRETEIWVVPTTSRRGLRLRDAVLERSPNAERARMLR